MANRTKTRFLRELARRYGGSLRRLGRSQSLYEIGDAAARVYIRYSRVHGGNTTFYGLREQDLQSLEGYPSLLCFLWNDQAEPLLVPFSDYEDVFQSTSPAPDGQYKAHVYLREEGTELHIARAGRFNVEEHFGWKQLEALVDSSRSDTMPNFSHSQMQTILGHIGATKGYDIWVPRGDRGKLDWSITGCFDCRDVLPYGFESVERVLQEVDVIWIRKGSSQLRSLFEVEHSTPIYSGLLRFNDIHLTIPHLRPTSSIVANDTRRSLFVREVRRPTFQASGLSHLCSFLEYASVFRWYMRVKGEARDDATRPA